MPPPPIPPAPAPPSQDRGKQIETLKGQIAALQQNNQQLELKKRDGEMQVTRIDSELFALKTEGDQLEIALGHSVANLRAATDKVAALKARLSSCPETERPAVQAELDKVAPDVPKYTAETEDLNRKKADLANRLQAKTNERSKVAAEVTGCVNAIQQNLGQLMRLEAALRQLESAVPPPGPAPAPAPGPAPGGPSGWWPPN